MPSPFDAYSEGYAKGKKSTAGGALAEITMGMLRDDPGGHFAAGYRDGAGGKKFNPPSAEVAKAAPRKPAGSSATPLEKAWWALCDSSAFIPQHMYEYYATALKAQGSQVALMIGLSDFTAHTCPKCGNEGQFKIRFLGRLEHPECHWTGYMGTGSYIGFQISQILHSGYRAAGSMKEDADRKGDRSGGWIYGIFGFLFVGVFRATLAVVLIPLHAAVALCQPGQTTPQTVTRIITLCVVAAGFGTVFYEAQHASSTPQFQQVQPSQPAGFVSQGVNRGSYILINRCHACAWPSWQTCTLGPLAKAGFHAVTGTFQNARIFPQAPDSWPVDIIVGPFPNDFAAKANIRRLANILRPLPGLCDSPDHAKFSLNQPDEFMDLGATVSLYTMMVVR